jgi:hypothetical protein
LDEKAAFQADEAQAASSASALTVTARSGAEGESVDFASRRATLGKMQLWLTTFTALATIAVLVVVSMSVMHAH